MSRHDRCLLLVFGLLVALGVIGLLLSLHTAAGG